MIANCRVCKQDFLTEADPHIVTPTPQGHLVSCTCETTALKKQLDEANDVIGWYAKARADYEEDLSGVFICDSGPFMTMGKRARAYLNKYSDKKGE